MGLIEVEFLRRVKGWFFPESPNLNNAGLFDHLEGWWGRFAVWAKLCLFVGIFVVLIVIWVCVNPELAQFIGYLLGGLLLFRQIAIFGKRATAAEKTAEAMQETAQSTEKGNIAERFKNAIEHLGHESVSVRLGGVYALHHIAQEVEEYRERVFEILCAHIREITTQEAYKPRIIESTREVPTIEIQSILYLLFVNTPGREIYKGLDTILAIANLKGARLAGANLKNAIFSYTILDYADLSKADLQGAYLLMASLQEADLTSADLQAANLPYSELKSSILYKTNLQEANLYQANLQEANLYKANLQGADLQEANLQDVDLVIAEYYNIDQLLIKQLLVEQLLSVKTLYGAKLPGGVENIIRQQKPTLFEEPSDEDDI